MRLPAPFDKGFGNRLRSFASRRLEAVARAFDPLSKSEDHADEKKNALQR